MQIGWGFTTVLKKELRRKSLQVSAIFSLISVCGFMLAFGTWAATTGPLLPRPAAVFRQDMLIAVALLSVIVGLLATVSATAALPGPASKHEEEGIRMAGIRPYSVAAARSLAGALPAAAALAGSAVAFCSLNFTGAFAPSLKSPDITSMLLAHLAILPCAITTAVATYTFGSIIQGLYSRPAAIFGGIYSGVINIVAIAFINPAVMPATLQSWVINMALIVNPVACAAYQLHYDVLRERRIYTIVKAHDYPFQYPALGSCFLLAAVAVVISGIFIEYYTRKNSGTERWN